MFRNFKMRRKFQNNVINHSTFMYKLLTDMNTVITQNQNVQRTSISSRYNQITNIR